MEQLEFEFNDDRQQQESNERDFYFLVKDFKALCDFWGVDNVMDFYFQNNKEFFDQIREYFDANQRRREPIGVAVCGSPCGGPDCYQGNPRG